MIYMFGEKAAKELRDREVREQTREFITRWLDDLDEDDALSARAELVEMFAIEPRRDAERLESLRRIKRGSYNPLQEMQLARASSGLGRSPFDIFGF